jgi:predicted metal-binding membrane protein
MTAGARQTILPAALVAMSATAWVALSRLGESPWGPSGHSHGLHHAPTGASLTPVAATFIGGWLLMTVAMMLPTTLPLVQVFRRLTSARRDGVLLTLIVIVGYVVAWTAFGALVFGASTLLQRLADGNPWLAAHPRAPSAALFFVAGAFQFSDLKYRCLDKCRSPLSFVTSRWRGTHERWHSFRLGVEHGAFCVGCCWALMLLMFASAVTSLAWMLLLGALMAVEKNVSWGRRVAAPVGIALLAAGGVVLFTG